MHNQHSPPSAHTRRAYPSHSCTTSHSPVYDAFAVQELESRGDLGAVETRSELVKSAAVLDMEHEVAARQVLHHEEQMTLEGKKKAACEDCPRR